MHLAFDIGNVLCHVNFDDFLNELSRYKNINTSEAYAFLGRIQKLHDVGFSLLRDELIDHFNINSNAMLDNLIDKWNNSVTINEDVILLLENLIKTNDAKIAILSNIGLEHDVLMKKNIVERLMKVKKENVIPFFSCDVGCRKPSYLYYHTFLSMYPQFKNCIYFDDRVENILAAKKFGIHSHLIDLDKSENIKNYLYDITDTIASQQYNKL